MPAEELLYSETKWATRSNLPGISPEDPFVRESIDLLNLYKKEITGYSVLSAREEYELAVRMERGDTEARNIIIQSFLFFVLNMAHRFDGYGLPLADLIQEGNMGLLKAAGKFSVSKNYRFITYAGWWVRMEMIRAIKIRTNIVFIPMHIYGKVNKVKSAIRKGMAANGEYPAPEDIENVTGLSSGQIRNLPFLSKNVVSLNDMAGKDEHFTFEDMIVDSSSESNITECLEREYRFNMVASLISKLKEREKKVIILRYGFEGDNPMTLEAISHKMGITRERVRQIEKQTLSKMRVWVKDVTDL